MPRVTINGKSIDVQDGQTILQAATDLGITIPTLCHHKDLSPVGSCRLCMVEVDSSSEQIAACSAFVDDGMVVQTESDSLTESRRFVLRMLLNSYRSTNEEDDNEFLQWVRRYGLKPPKEQPVFTVDSDPNPFIRMDMNQCILCTRCVRACEEVQGRFVLGVSDRGVESKIIAGADTSMLDARCESCGACATYCPTGALTDRFAWEQPQPDRKITTTCSYCGVGCQFDLNVKDEKVIGVTSNPKAPVNGLSLCVKGRYGWDYINHEDRLTSPRVRRYLIDENMQREPNGDRGEWVDVDWQTALSLVARKIVTIKEESGPDAIGFLASAKCTNEDNYLYQKLARQVIGTNNIDHCARLCHSSSVAALLMSVGSGAMSNSMRDITEHSEAIFIIGSNTTEQHPVFGTMIRQAILRRGVKLIVADPRCIDITEFATIHLRQKPGTDVALLNGLAHIILKNNWHDEQFINDRCEDFEIFQSSISNYTPDHVSQITGVSVADLHQTAELMGTHRPMATLWGMGITQHTNGVMSALGLTNLQLLLGNLGIPGGGLNPLRGQNNVQGASDMGSLPNVFPGYQSVADDQIVSRFEKAWALNSPEINGDGPSFGLSSKPGRTVTEIVGATGKREIRALVIMGEDPLMSEPDLNQIRYKFMKSEFVVVQDIFPSETSKYADVLLPGAAFAEKTGTFSNTDRRIQFIRPAVDPPGSARPDWEIIQDLAQRILNIENRGPIGPQASWNHTSAAGIMDEIADVTPIYAGVNYDRIEKGEQLHWPVPDSNHPGSPILHIGKFTRGKGKFHATEHLPPKELPDEEFPLLLTTGRVLYHWHGGEMTRRSSRLLEVYPESLLEISAEDAARNQIDDFDRVRVLSRRGEMLCRAIVSRRVSEGVVFGNFHFPGSENVNNLTISALDPVSKIPEYKVCSVCVSTV